MAKYAYERLSAQDNSFLVFEQLLINRKFAHRASRQLELKIPELALAHGHQRPRAGVFSRGTAGCVRWAISPGWPGLDRPITWRGA